MALHIIFAKFEGTDCVRTHQSSLTAEIPLKGLLMDENIQVLIAHLAETLEIDPNELREDSKSVDIESWDSMSIVNIMLMIEKQYAVKIPLTDIMQLNSVEGIAAFLREHGKL